MQTVTVSVPVATAERMRTLGAALGRAAVAGDRFLLEGPFGAGKTTFVQGLAVGLGVVGAVTSPSFVIENQYRGRLTLYHVDLFRLERVEQELWESLEEHLYGDGVTAVEWAERLPEPLRDGATVVRFELGDDQTRRVDFESPSERFATAAQQL
jgi:tRNA threonylcarbamoyladenosine biosynthesis protein TsaE